MSAATPGATPAPSGPAADQSPTAVVRLDSGNSGNTNAKDDGKIAAPANACRTRLRLRVITVPAVAENTADKANTSNPSWKIRLRPIRSARRPASGKNAAVPIKKPTTPQPTSAAVAPTNPDWMSSRAIFVAVLLNPTSTVASDATHNARHARGGTASSGARAEVGSATNGALRVPSVGRISRTVDSTTGICRRTTKSLRRSP